MPRQPWVDKTFEFDFPVGAYQELLVALAQTPAKVARLIAGVAEVDLVRRDGEHWSIQENVGHLADLEELFLGRLDDYDAGLKELRAADMTNEATEQARHNERDLGDVLTEFAAARSAYLMRLQDQPESYFATVAWHPRLSKPMRVVDQLKFQAAHDAHHLERIEELL